MTRPNLDFGFQQRDNLDEKLLIRATGGLAADLLDSRPERKFLWAQRWEVEFLEDGSVEVERFISTGEIESEIVLKELFDKFSD